MSEDDAQHKAPPSPRMKRRALPRARGGVLLAALALSAVAASAAASAALSRPNASEPVTLEKQLQSEIDDMLASGVPRNSPKVRMLQDSLDQLRSPAIGRPRHDPEGDVSGLLSGDAGAVQPRAGVASASGSGGDAVGTAGGASGNWDSGPIDCEPIPGLLSAAEVAGASCVGVPQPDGTSRYVAIGADGVARTVLFGADGRVQRLPDTQVTAGLAPGTALTPTPEGDLQIAPPGRQPTVVDVG